MQNISFPKSFLNAFTIFLAIYQSQSKYSRLVLQKNFSKKKTLWPLFMDGSQLSQGYRATKRRQLTCHQSVTKSTWYPFCQPRKDERLSRPWRHSVDLNPVPQDWESGILTTRPLLQLRIQRLQAETLITCFAYLWDLITFQDSQGPLQWLTSSAQDCLPN